MTADLEPAPELIGRWAHRPCLAVMDPSAAMAAGEQSRLPRLRDPIYLVTGELQVLGDAIAGVFACSCDHAGVELVIDVDRALIRCVVRPGEASFADAVGRWLCESACFGTMQPEDAPLYAMDVATALRRIFAQLGMAAAAIENRAGELATGFERFDAERGTRWIVGLEAGHQRRRSYHAREVGLARSSRSQWVDTIN